MSDTMPNGPYFVLNPSRIYEIEGKIHHISAGTRGTILKHHRDNIYLCSFKDDYQVEIKVHVSTRDMFYLRKVPETERVVSINNSIRSLRRSL